MTSPRVLHRDRIFEGRVVKLDVDRIVEPSGAEVRREIVRHPGAAVLLAVTPERRVLFVRQYRYAAGEEMLEVPAGTLDPGESPEETARRELVEETGYAARSLSKLAEFYPSPGILTERMHLFLATDLERGEASPEDDEHLVLLELPVSEALRLEVGSELKDAKTIIALSLLRNDPRLESLRSA